MNHTEVLTRYIANFVDELVKSGVGDVVISPGSRSTPLAMTVCEHEGMKEWVMIDERSAAFFALGIAKQTGRAVILICTSGTAAANYFPAIVEAKHGRVPLIVLTADRPHELRDVGAPQAIEQIKMYGEYVKWFQEMALPEATPKMLSYVRSTATRAAFVAEEGNAGPVHLNFPLREPLIPDFTIDNIWGKDNTLSHNPRVSGIKRLPKKQLIQLAGKLIGQKGVIVCGPQVDSELADAIVRLASQLCVPILADPLSQLRSGQHKKDHIIEGYDAIFRNSAIREQLKPDYIIRFGAMPVSKSYLFYVEEHQDVLQYIIEGDEGFRDPTGNRTEIIYADPNSLCADILSVLGTVIKNEAWLNEWQEMNQIAKRHLLQESTGAITEGETVRGLLRVIPDQSCLYVGNSMAVRDLDSFFMTTEKNISVLANRGTNGIDGIVSSGLGVAATSGKPTTLLIGDLSFYHDLNGLLAAKHYQLDITILLINNDGGGIFSFLPQANDAKYFEVLFGTPLGIDFAQVISMYGGKYSHVTNETELHTALKRSYSSSGLTVIEVKTDRTENVKWHRKKWREIEADLLKR